MMSELLRLHTHFPPFEKGRAAPGLILCLCGAFPAPPLCAGLAYYRHSTRMELLLIYRIQSHTHPKRRKFCLKHAGQKSVKDKLPEQRKGPKRAVECRLKVQTHVWEDTPGQSHNFISGCCAVGSAPALGPHSQTFEPHTPDQTLPNRVKKH